MPKPLVFYVEFEVRPEGVEKFLKGATAVLEAMSHEDTFIMTSFHRDANNPNRFTMYEQWNEPSMEAFMKNQVEGKAYRDEYESYVNDLLASPRKFTVLDPIGEWKS